MNTILKNGVRLAGVGAVSAVALGFFSAGAANADTFVALPDGQITRTIDGGTTVTVSRVGESATINPSLGSTPLHRNVWVNGTAVVDVTGPKSSGSIEPGYIVGCQLDFGANAGGGAGAGAAPGAEGVTVTPSAEVGGGVTLGPGQAANFPLLDLEAADDFGGETHNRGNSFSGNSGSVTWQDANLGIAGCAGYAQARSYITATVGNSNTSSKVTLWGQPFSIG